MRIKNIKRRAPLLVDSDEDQEDLISQHVEARREAKCNRLKLEEDRLDFEQRKYERDAERKQRLQEQKVLRLSPDERRIIFVVVLAAIDHEECHDLLAERIQMISVMGALVKKLQ
ncbi:unnamed protein product [Agarophyton chilense]